MKIQIDDLFYIYSNGDETVVALRGLHLNVESGEFLAIRGPNGSGKSTLVKLLTGFLSPTAGNILLDGDDLSKMDPLRLRREYVASIDQRGNLLRDLTVLENVSLAFTLIGSSISDSQRSARLLLESHELGNQCHKYPEQLSAGERQLSSLLVAVAIKPKILVADEPSGDLDDVTAESVYKMLQSASESMTVLLVTHDSRAEKFVDRIVRMRDGRISEEWLPGNSETSVIDPLGWMRVQSEERKTLIPDREKEPVFSAVEPCLLRGENLGLKYGEKSIFSDVNIGGAAGELIAISAHTGTGKSSLLRILAGIQNPTAGTVSIREKLLWGMSRENRAALRKETIGFLQQGDAALNNISLADHVGHVRSKLEKYYGSRMKRPLSGFSGGERARIELLRILAEGRAILLLDEPTAQLDEHLSFEMVELLLNYVKAGALVITSTRDETLLASANRVVSLSGDY